MKPTLENFCVVVLDKSGNPVFVSANLTESEAYKLLHLLAEGEVVSADEGRAYKKKMMQMRSAS